MKVVTVLGVAVLLAACAAGEATPSASTPPASPSAPPASPTPDATVLPTAATPTDEGFWVLVRSGLDDAGRLSIVLESDEVPVELFFMPDASAARVDGAFVSLCDGGRAYAGDAAGLAPVPGSWRCGFDALVDGLRASGRPNDAWSADFPTESFGTVAVAVEPGGTWTWTLEQAMGPEGPASTRLELDPTSGRLLGGRVVDEAGVMTLRVDYLDGIPPFPVP
jgi:hypothetical protein